VNKKLSRNEFNQILEKLDVVIKLLAMNVVQGRTLKEQVKLLSETGLQPKQIASILGKKPGHIRVILYNVRKEQAKEAEIEGKEEIEESIQRKDESNV
jgi:hypothetical protein